MRFRPHSASYFVQVPHESHDHCPCAPAGRDLPGVGYVKVYLRKGSGKSITSAHYRSLCYCWKLRNFVENFGSLQELSKTMAIISPAVGRESNTRSDESRLGREFHTRTWKVLKTTNDKRGKGFKMYVPLKGQVAQLLGDMVRSFLVGLVIRKAPLLFNIISAPIHTHWSLFLLMYEDQVLYLLPLFSPPFIVSWVASMWSVRYGMLKYELMRSALPCLYCSKQSESQDLSNKSRPPVRGYTKIEANTEFVNVYDVTCCVDLIGL